MLQTRTHEVLNQPPPLEDYDPFALDAPLREAVDRAGAGWATDRVSELGRRVGSAEMIELGRRANRFVPELRTFDRYGHRIDEVELDDSFDRLMTIGRRAGIPSIPWVNPRPGAHSAHTAMTYLFYQAEAGVVCSLLMSYAAVPTLRHQPEVAAAWEHAVLADDYDGRSVPAGEKRAATIAMAMTEKQGGSDLRANTTVAVPVGTPGPGQRYLLTGHKWFCSMPMSDAILTLARVEHGVSCFLVPRFTPDGERNRVHLQRLKDKLGNRSNPSAEIEYDGTWALMVGEPGRGIATLMEMVHHSRLDVAAAPAAFMRLGLVQAVHHARHRRAFSRRLVEQPLMVNVLADLAVESEAATTLLMRLGRCFDGAERDPMEASLARIGTSLTKYWLNKRVVPHTHEALESLGGSGYIEESDLPRLYREGPLNGIWEGSGSVIALDLQRALRRDERCRPALLAELEPAAGCDPGYDRLLAEVTDLLDGADDPVAARRLAERTALCWQAALLVRHAPGHVAEAFLAGRVRPRPASAFGSLPASTDLEAILDRAVPERP
ncbi:acyl-CoA dehydrogenase family protein [Pseudonocardia acaciae]|uniref:acyl-CoA dehydrogenase family protein n=1 Tax=Pseudonocardia acaciae TaxID=551276 RepID=UPI00048F3E6C|nr:acyl-CoA dehydrogenase family protein [Pseudonocardia acaciae]